jgi:hypothetical protein
VSTQGTSYDNKTKDIRDSVKAELDLDPTVDTGDIT